MIIYQDTEKELTFADYKTLSNFNLIKFTLNELKQLYNNLEEAADNAYIYHNELLAMAIEQDIRKVNLYITMKQRKAAKKEG